MVRRLPRLLPAIGICAGLLAAGRVELLGQISPATSEAPAKAGPAKSAPATTSDERLQQIIRAYQELEMKSSRERTYSTFAPLLERQRTQDLREALGVEAADKANLQLTNIGRQLQDTVRFLAESEQIVVTPEETMAIFRLRHDHDLAYPRNSTYAREEWIKSNRDADEAERRIREILGAQRFDAFLQREDLAYRRVFQVVSEAGLPPSRAYEVWQVKAETRSRIDAIPVPAITPQVEAQFKAQAKQIAQEAEAKVIGLIGEKTYRNATPPAFDWIKDL